MYTYVVIWYPLLWTLGDLLSALESRGHSCKLLRFALFSEHVHACVCVCARVCVHVCVCVYCVCMCMYTYVVIWYPLLWTLGDLLSALYREVSSFQGKVYMGHSIKCQ